MRILLDECVPAPLASLLESHTCMTVQSRGWGGITNGALLKLAEGEFDLFVTADQSIAYQQNLKSTQIAILELSTNDIHRISAAASLIQTALKEIKPREYKRLNIA